MHPLADHRAVNLRYRATAPCCAEPRRGCAADRRRAHGVGARQQANTGQFHPACPPYPSAMIDFLDGDGMLGSLFGAPHPASCPPKVVLSAATPSGGYLEPVQDRYRKHGACFLLARVQPILGETPQFHLRNRLSDAYTGLRTHPFQVFPDGLPFPGILDSMQSPDGFYRPSGRELRRHPFGGQYDVQETSVREGQ